MSERSPNIEELFALADKVGKKRYHRLTSQDFEDYRKFDHWRYVNGDFECGTTKESRRWVREHSSWACPVCERKFSDCGGPTVDHKLPRAQYPWLSMEFKNLWVICRDCNREKAERHWYEYEHYIFVNYPDRYQDIAFARPRQLLKNL
ncbi:MAG: HNH endonuclease signature motif containing protein [Cyanobacteria bacterium J06555_13]